MNKKPLAAILGMLLFLTGCGQKQADTQNTNQVTPNSINTVQTEQKKIFTLEELKQYDGQNGNPAYIAVKGVVYDVTNSRHFTNGKHNECASTTAGNDLTKQFPHGSGVLKQFPVVGSIKQ